MSAPTDFSQWLASRNVDIEHMEPELRAALERQWQAEQPPERVLLILDGCDSDRWQHAVLTVAP